MGWVLRLGQGHVPMRREWMGWVLGLGQGTGGSFWVSFHKCAVFVLSWRQTNASMVPKPSRKVVGHISKGPILGTFCPPL